MNGGPLSDVKVDLPVSIVNFMSLYPPRDLPSSWPANMTRPPARQSRSAASVLAPAPVLVPVEPGKRRKAVSLSSTFYDPVTSDFDHSATRKPVSPLASPSFLLCGSHIARSLLTMLCPILILQDHGVHHVVTRLLVLSLRLRLMRDHLQSQKSGNLSSTRVNSGT